MSEHQGEDWQKALQCAKSQGWDPRADFADSDLDIDRAVGLVVWVAPHQILGAGTVADEEELMRATAEVPGDYSEGIREVLRQMPERKGTLRTVIITLSDEPKIGGVHIKL